MDLTWRIDSGAVPGLANRVTALHAEYYKRESGFGAAFRDVVAQGLAEFLPRLHRPMNGLWRVEVEGVLHGHIAVDGEDLGPGLAHLRWFITSDVLRGQGAGKALIEAALAHCDAQGFAETHLWTFAGLDAARVLYERYGFRLAEAYDGDQWGHVVREQKWVRPQAG